MSTGDGITTPRTYPEETDERERYTGQALRGDWWVKCDVCNRVLPFSKTTRNTRTTAQAGLRVCSRCLDEPGRDDLRDQYRLPAPPEERPA